VNRTRLPFTLLLAMIWGSIPAQDAWADIRGPVPGVDAGAGISIIAAILVAVAIACYVLIRRKRR
jgi:hypothetical protein